MSLASKIEFKKLCTVLEEIVNVHKCEVKIKILYKFIEQCKNTATKLKEKTNTSLYPILRLLLPSLERERGPLNLKEKSLAILYIRIFCLPKNSSEARKLTSYRLPISNKNQGSDFSERVYWVFRCRMVDNKNVLSIEDINSLLNDIAMKNITNQNRDEIFKAIVQQISAIELKWLTRIILKDLKLGLSIKRILEVYHPIAPQQFNVTSDLRKICDLSLDVKKVNSYQVQLFNHFKPMLLERLSIENIYKLFNYNEKYFVQTKFDGERSQIHMRNGEFKYFTRQGFDITNNACYGEKCSSNGYLTKKIVSLLNKDCQSIILDGELMGWHKYKQKFGSKAMNYDVKKLSMNSIFQPCFVAFDIIMYNDNILTTISYEKRFEILRKSFTEEKGVFELCTSQIISNRSELLTIFSQSMKNNEEGIVLKRIDNIYQPNVRSGHGCYKIKAEYSDNLVQDIDLIILGGYYGEGKNAGKIISFLMGTAETPPSGKQIPVKFYAVVTVSNGVNQNQLQQLQVIFDKFSLKTCPQETVGPKNDLPHLWISPQNSVILTLRATEMIRTKYYPLGYSLRFPRVLQIRKDKAWYDTCTVKELLSLVKDSGVVQKLTKQYDVTKNEQKYKTSDQVSSLSGKTVEKITFLRMCKSIVPISRLLYKKEICVINGNKIYSKEYIKEKLLQHRATIVQYPTNQTFCVIVGDIKSLRAENIIKSGKYDVVSCEWLEYIENEHPWVKLPDFLPWHLLSKCNNTAERLGYLYDKYYDSFKEDADEDSLKRSLNEAQRDIFSIDYEEDYLEKLDKELFENGISPFSKFRNPLVV